MSRKTDPAKQNKKLKDQIVRQHHHLQLALQVIELATADLNIASRMHEIIQEVNTGVDFSRLRGEDMHQIAAIFNYPLTQENDKIEVEVDEPNASTANES